MVSGLTPDSVNARPGPSARLHTRAPACSRAEGGSWPWAPPQAVAVVTPDADKDSPLLPLPGVSRGLWAG